MSLFRHRLLMAKALEMANPYLPADMPAAIRDSLVLYYDLNKQGATNESMAENPVLIDLSGNGNDATCYNFGWSGMSGIGGYEVEFISKKADISTPTRLKVSKTQIENSYQTTTLVLAKSYDHDIEFQIKLTNITGNATIKWGWIGSIGFTLYSEDGIYTLTNKAGNNVTMAIEFEDDVDPNALVEIELLPLYPNALVSDGVDDYCFVQDKYDDEGNLINKKSLVLNRENGYTVIAKRKWINPPIKGEDMSKGICFLSKRKTQIVGAFVTEFYNNVSKNWICRSFSSNIDINSISTEDIVYQKSTSYNGQFPLSVSNWNDDDTLYISSLVNIEQCGSVALYSLILFDRDLTDEEIEWVKNNLMQ